jgi:hypothetical protein
MHRSNVLSPVRDSVINNNGFWIVWLHLLTPSLNLSESKSLSTAHNQCPPKTRSILTGLRLSFLLVFLLLWLTWFWFTNHLLLLHERIPNNGWRRTNHLRMNSYLVLLSTATPPVRRNAFKISKLKLCYDRRSVGQSLSISSTHLGLKSRLFFCRTVPGLLMWGALSDERTGLSFPRVTVSSNMSLVSTYNLHFTCY